MVTLKTVILDSEKCIGCITCMRRCPTEAIRIENQLRRMRAQLQGGSQAARVRQL